jgi:hypothetical protein
MSIFNNLKTEKQYKASTGLAKGEFDQLFEYFQKYYVPKKANPFPNTPQPVLTDKREALFFILHYMKAYPTLENMGLYFGFDIRTVSDYLERIKPCLKAALDELGTLPPSLFKSQDEFEEAFEGVKELYIDGSEVAINRSQDNDRQRFNFSGKKKDHTLKVNIISDRMKLIRYLGRLWNGKSHDKKIFDQELGHIDFEGKITYLDLGFYGVGQEEKGGLVMMPRKKPKGRELTEIEKEENRLLASVRVRVEHAIGGLKRYFILKIRNRFHYNLKTYDSLQLCAGLWNFKLLTSS